MSTLALCTLLVSGLGFAAAFSPGSVCAGHVLVTSSAKALAEVQACSCEIAYTEHSLKEKVCELGYVCCGDSYEVDVSYSTAIEVVAIEKSIDPEDVPQDVMDAATASGASGCKSYQYELENEKYEFDECAAALTTRWTPTTCPSQLITTTTPTPGCKRRATMERGGAGADA